MPAVLRVRERPGVADLLPEEERVDRCNGRCQRDACQRAQPLSVAPRQERQRREQCEAGRSGQDREPGDEPGAGEAIALGERECCEDEQQEQRLAVDRLKEERVLEGRE